jgi:hypothetical protein
VGVGSADAPGQAAQFDCGWCAALSDKHQNFKKNGQLLRRYGMSALALEWFPAILIVAANLACAQERIRLILGGARARANHPMRRNDPWFWPKMFQSAGFQRNL